MKYIFLIVLFSSQIVLSQGNRELQAMSDQFMKEKEVKKLIGNLEDHIDYLADDKLEGRRTGSAGEKLAYEYIIKQFKKYNITALNANEYLQPFEVNEGRKLMPGNSFQYYGFAKHLNTDYFPLAYSANGVVSVSANPREILYFDIGPVLQVNKTNPHFDINEYIVNLAGEEKKKGNEHLIIVNSSSIPDNLKFDEKDKRPTVSIPVIYLKHGSIPKSDAMPLNSRNEINLKVRIQDGKRTGHNVIAYINNNAANTVVLGAHYDHLGYGEDKNSLYSGKETMIHNGADDNASGTAALIELAAMLKKSDLKNNNYVFIAFSGEELGLFGSKYFVENIPAGIGNINYMINMDMLGRLNDSTRGLTVGGYGTSPVWYDIVTKNDNYLRIKFDSTGSGPSDHTSFYRKDIPVLFFFTGTHKDYHKPSDDEDKINYAGEAQVIRYIYHVMYQADAKGKLAFTKTREAATATASSFKVSLGIMPDYTYDGNGVLVDGVSENRPAIKAGIKAGDVLYQLGDHPFSDVQSYMKALNQFNKGETTKVKVKRGKEELVFEITF